MACKSLISKKIQVSFALLVFFAILTNTSKVAFAIDNMLIYFYNDKTDQVVGFCEGYVGTVSMTRMSGISSYTFDILDKDGNVYKSGFVQGELPKDKDIYPITLKLNANIMNSSSNYIEIKVEYVKDTSNLDVIPGLIEQLNYDLLNKLDQLKEKLAGILDSLKEIDDYLSNPAYLEKGFDDLDRSIKKVNTNPLSDMQSSVNKLDGLSPSSGSSSGGFEIPLTIGGQKFNAFDISGLADQLVLIRNLMKAIIWIEFAVFCIRVVVPKFKV